MSEDPNAYQISGSHYASAAYQHWDLVEDLGLGYLEGCATKYVTRWRKKNGVEDLRKALHYVEKLQARLEANALQRHPPLADGVRKELLGRFILANELTDQEAKVLMLLSTVAVGRVEMAQRIITDMIDYAVRR